jgi:hypothetical protein
MAGLYRISAIAAVAIIVLGGATFGIMQFVNGNSNSTAKVKVEPKDSTATVTTAPPVSKPDSSVVTVPDSTQVVSTDKPAPVEKPKVVSEYAKLMAQGDAQYALGHYKIATGLYKKAYQVEKNEDATHKISDCKYEMSVQKPARYMTMNYKLVPSNNASALGFTVNYSFVNKSDRPVRIRMVVPIGRYEDCEQAPENFSLVRKYKDEVTIGPLSKGSLSISTDKVTQYPPDQCTGLSAEYKTYDLIEFND